MLTQRRAPRAILQSALVNAADTDKEKSLRCLRPFRRHVLNLRDSYRSQICPTFAHLLAGFGAAPRSNRCGCCLSGWRCRFENQVWMRKRAADCQHSHWLSSYLISRWLSLVTPWHSTSAPSFDIHATTLSHTQLSRGGGMR